MFTGLESPTHLISSVGGSLAPLRSEAHTRAAQRPVGRRARVQEGAAGEGETELEEASYPHEERKPR